MAETLDLNGVTLTRAFEWQGNLMTRPQLIPDSDRADWEANRSWLAPAFWDPATEDTWLCSQTIVVRSAGKTILIDTGIGNHKSRPYIPPFDNLDTGFLKNLRTVGVDPADVDIVINTHLHADHVGWNTHLVGGQWVSTFPNATYLLPQADFDHWNPESDTEPSGGMDQAPVFADSVLPVVRAGLVQFYDGTHLIDEHLTLEPAPGHSPGSSIVHVSSGSEKVIVAGDVFHTPMEILRPDQGACFDEDHALAVQSRRRLLAQAAEQSLPIITGHFPIDRAAVVARRGDSYVIDDWVSIQ